MYMWPGHVFAILCCEDVDCAHSLTPHAHASPEDPVAPALATFQAPTQLLIGMELGFQDVAMLTVGLHLSPNVQGQTFQNVLMANET